MKVAVLFLSTALAAWWTPFPSPFGQPAATNQVRPEAQIGPDGVPTVSALDAQLDKLRNSVRHKRSSTEHALPSDAQYWKRIKWSLHEFRDMVVENLENLEDEDFAPRTFNPVTHFKKARLRSEIVKMEVDFALNHACQYNGALECMSEYYRRAESGIRTGLYAIYEPVAKVLLSKLRVEDLETFAPWWKEYWLKEQKKMREYKQSVDEHGLPPESVLEALLDQLRIAAPQLQRSGPSHATPSSSYYWARIGIALKGFQEFAWEYLDDRVGKKDVGPRTRNPFTNFNIARLKNQVVKMEVQYALNYGCLYKRHSECTPEYYHFVEGGIRAGLVPIFQRVAEVLLADMDVKELETFTANLNNFLIQKQEDTARWIRRRTDHGLSPLSKLEEELDQIRDSVQQRRWSWLSHAPPASAPYWKRLKEALQHFWKSCEKALLSKPGINGFGALDTYTRMRVPQRRIKLVRMGVTWALNEACDWKTAPECTRGYYRWAEFGIRARLWKLFWKVVTVLGSST